MSYSRAAHGLAAALAAVSGLALLTGCGGGTSQKPSAHAGLAGRPPKQILSEAIAAARAAGSLHFASTTRAGSVSAVYSDDSSPSAGRQVITISGHGHATILVVAGVGYIRGDAAALTGFFGLPASTASRLVGRWLSIRPGDTGYQQVTQGVTAGSVLDEATPVGRLTVTGLRTVDGQSVVGVRGEVPASAGMPAGSADTLYVAATGRPLPVSCQEGLGSNQVSAVFSGWGKTVHVAAPRHATPFPSGSGSSSA